MDTRVVENIFIFQRDDGELQLKWLVKSSIKNNAIAFKDLSLTSPLSKIGRSPE